MRRELDIYESILSYKWSNKWYFVFTRKIISSISFLVKNASRWFDAFTILNRGAKIHIWTCFQKYGVGETYFSAAWISESHDNTLLLFASTATSFNIFHLSNDTSEDIFDILVLLGRSLKKCSLHFCGKIFALFLCHSPVHMKICFVANQDDRNTETKRYFWLVSKNRTIMTSLFVLSNADQVHQFFMDIFANFETMHRIDGINQNVTVNIDGILCGEYGVLILASCVDYMQVIMMAIDVHCLVECCK